MSARRKLLIESSAVPAAVGRTTEAHRARFEKICGDSTLHTSTYIRKELLRRWVVDYIHLAQVIAESPSVADALRRLSHDFSGRAKGSYLNALADLEVLRTRCADPSDVRQVARKCAHAALQIVWDFDDVFESRIENKSACRIGNLEVPADGNDLIDALVAFCERLGEPVRDCAVNTFLDFGNADGHVAKLLACKEVARLKKTREPLAKFAAQGQWITCYECAQIGDAVIAMEHAAQAAPSEYRLVHTDHAFDRYCPCLGLGHERMPAAVAVDRPAEVTGDAPG